MTQEAEREALAELIWRRIQTSFGYLGERAWDTYRTSDLHSARRAYELADEILAAGFRQTTAAHDAQVRAEERERCALVAESEERGMGILPVGWVARKIRQAPLAIREGEEP